MGNGTTVEHVKQMIKMKSDGFRGPVVFNGGNGVLLQGSMHSLRGSRWLQSRVNRLFAEGASGEKIMAAIADGLRFVTRKEAYWRRMSKAIAPVSRQIVTASAVARTCVRESTSDSNDDGDGGDDPGGGSEGESDPDASKPLNWRRPLPFARFPGLNFPCSFFPKRKRILSPVWPVSTRPLCVAFRRRYAA
jgi:hypothetical protein